MRTAQQRIDWAAYLYLLPAFLVFVPFLFFPLLHGFWFSLYEWDGVSPSTWVGLGNYVDLFGDGPLLRSFLNSGVLIVFFAVVPICLALLLTGVMAHAGRMRFLTFFRVAIFLPQVIAAVVVGTVWLGIYAPNGVLNGFLKLLGLEVITKPWLGDFGWALPALGLIGTWLQIGLCLVLFLAGTSQIDPELYEAARLDGAGMVREFFAVTLPGLRPQIVVAMTLTVVASLKSFDLVYITTQGGPGEATRVPAFEIYRRAFQLNEVGSAAAVGILLTVVILVITFVINRLDTAERS